MKNLLFFAATVWAILAQGQSESPYALVYKPSVAALVSYTENESSADLLASIKDDKPLDTLYREADSNCLPTAPGVYLLVYLYDQWIHCELKYNGPFTVDLSRFGNKEVLRVFNNSTLQFVANAEVYFDGKSVKYNKKLHGFTTHRMKHETRNILVICEGIPVFTTSYENYNRKYFEKWNRFYFRDKWDYLTDKEYRKAGKEDIPNYRNMSYLATNKPMFRVADTLKLKAFVLKKNKRPYKKAAVLEMSYHSNKGFKTHTIDTLLPYKPGAFSYQTAVPDSLLGKNITLQLRDKKDRILQQTSIDVKDYTLNRINFKAELVAEAETYSPDVPLKIKYSAHDDLGFSAMEGAIRIVVNCTVVALSTAQPVLVLPNVLLDTLFQLDATGQGIFILPENYFPNACTNFKVAISYVAANGESHEKTWHKKWDSQPRKIHFKENNGQWLLQADSAFLPEGQKIVLAQSEEDFKYHYENEWRLIKKTKTKITLPYYFKNPMPPYWRVAINDTVVLKSEDVLKRNKDSFDWQITNNEVLYYRKEIAPKTTNIAVFEDGKKLVYLGTLQNDTLKLPANCQFYRINLDDVSSGYGGSTDYIWIKPKTKNNGADFLDLTATGPERIYPGDSATWALHLAKNDKPVADFDILAMAYKEAQFDCTSSQKRGEKNVLNKVVKYDRIKAPRHPKQGKFNSETYDEFSMTVIIKKWLQQMGVDTLPRYKYMFPEGGISTHFLPLPPQLTQPQFAPFVYEGGSQENVMAFWVDSKVRYVSAFTSWAYSSEVAPGVYAVVIRVRNKKITVPNVVMKLGFKTELALDLSNLPDSILVEETISNYTEEEWEEITKSIIDFQHIENFTLTQGQTQAFGSAKRQNKMGPFAHDTISFLSNNLSLDFQFRANQTYFLNAETKVLERTEIGTNTEKNYYSSGSYNRKLAQIPGAILQLTEKEMVDKYKYIEVPVCDFPKSIDGKNGTIKCMNNNHYPSAIIVYHNQTKTLFEVSMPELRGYKDADFPIGTYQFFVFQEAFAFSVPAFNLGENQTAYIDFEKCKPISIELALAQLLDLADTTCATRFWLKFLPADGLLQNNPSSLIKREDIKNMPFRSVSQIVTTTAGLSQADDGQNLEIRGGRALSEIVIIEDVKVRGATDIPRKKKLNEVIIGGLPTQYGDANEEDLPNDQSKNEVLAMLGSRGSNVRSNFSDYAFFIPDVQTDKQGNAKIKVQYPDDIANWQTYFIGMGKGEKYAFAQKNTLAYSEVSATLAMPRYLLAGDSCVFIGKTLNYLDTNLAVANFFVANGDTLFAEQNWVKDVKTHKLPVIAKDSLTATYGLKLENGYVDAEQRSVPILPVGLERKKGAFWVLQADTSVTFTSPEKALITVGAMHSATDFLREEVELQLEYVHSCNEQLASKLRAILALQTIAAAANQRERHTREANKIIKILLKNRNNINLWGWWANQETNLWMTAYVLETLLQAKNAGFEVDVENTLAIVKSRISIWDENARLCLLFACSEAQIGMPFAELLAQINFDKLTVSEKLKYALVAETQKLPYDASKVFSLFKVDMLGNTYVPADYTNSLAGGMYNTMLGANFLNMRQDAVRAKSCLQYVLLSRGQYEFNTIERAALIVLMRSFSEESNTTSTLTLHPDGQKGISLNESPMQHKHNGYAVTVTKSGGGIAFVSTTVSQFDANPEPENKDFNVKVAWQNAPVVGQKTSINIEVYAYAQAQYVMLEIPIPAGCTVIENNISISQLGNVYQEVKGKKVYVYVEKISGSFTWSIPVMPRFEGNYTLNPTKAELMYFPTKSGNNGVSRIEVKAAE